MTLAKTQEDFQNYLLRRNQAIESQIPDGPRAAKLRLLNVYRHAYGARLAECLQHDFPILNKLMGGDAFTAMALNYIENHPSRMPSVRWLGQNLPDFLSRHPLYKPSPALTDMARFEWAIGLAFDAADRPALHQADMASIPPIAWPGLTFEFHPSVQLIDLRTPTPDLWSLLQDDNDVPLADIAVTDEQWWLIWRKDLTVLFRSVELDEAQALRCALGGQAFSTICDELASLTPPDQSAYRAASLLGQWLESDLIVGVTGEAPLSQ